MFNSIIQLFILNGVWIARHLDCGPTRPSEMMIDLFGSHELPTAFTDEALAIYVLCEIQLLNPNSKVELV